jgi:hypothetical protein
MLFELTKEQVAENAAKVREYRTFNRDPKKRIMGILMDTSVGGFGLHENGAEKKADEILKEFTL